MRNEGAPSTVISLLETIVKTSQLLYMDDHKRNHTWLHMVLCRQLFSFPKKITCRNLFGSYLHSLVSHAPLQLEIVSHQL